MWMVLALLSGAALWAQSPGSFAGEYNGDGMRLKLQSSGNGYSGTIEYQGASLSLAARPSGADLEGAFRFQGQEYSFRIRRDGSALVLTTAATTYRLQPAGTKPANPLAQRSPSPAIGAGAASPAAAKEQGLVGTWRSSKGTIRFDAGGAGMANRAAFRYQVEGNTLTMVSADGTWRVNYSIDGARLRLSGSGGETEFNRVADSGGAGRIMPELAGKWCYVSNFNATDGGARASNQCFTLYPDGRYEYYGETDNYNRYGGVTSQSGDRGTWVATQTTITARSASGRVTTYQLEKRNHPQNNDPMLLLDGQAFVTYYQKPPWR